MKRLMVLGAGRGQVGLIKAVKKYGHRAIVASIDGDYPGFEYADEIINIDIADKYAVSEAARALCVDGIITACLNTGIEALGFACEDNGLLGLSAKAGEICADKLKMKTVFEKHGVNTAKFRAVFNDSDLDLAMAELRFPLMLKAVDLQGSRGIYICYNKEDMVSSYDRLKYETSKEYCVVEEFIDGYEISAEAFVANGEILYVLPVGDVTIKSDSAFVPGGHFIPCNIEEDVKPKVIQQAQKAIRAAGLDNCDVNFDMIVKDGEVYIIELSGRLGANCLPELISTHYGIDVYKLIIDAALGLDPSEYFENAPKPYTACYAEMIVSHKSGVLKEIINKNKVCDEIVDISFFVEKESEIRKFANSRDCIGQIVVKGASLDECKELVQQVKNNIEFVLV